MPPTQIAIPAAIHSKSYAIRNIIPVAPAVAWLCNLTPISPSPANKMMNPMCPSLDASGHSPLFRAIFFWGESLFCGICCFLLCIIYLQIFFTSRFFHAFVQKKSNQTRCFLLSYLIIHTCSYFVNPIFFPSHPFFGIFAWLNCPRVMDKLHNRRAKNSLFLPLCLLGEKYFGENKQPNIQNARIANNLLFF